MGAIFFWIVLAAMFIGIPVAFSLALGPMLVLIATDQAPMLKMFVSRAFGGLDSFIILAVPLYMLVGEIMNTGAITQRLTHFANTMVGHFKGGLAQTNILASIFFAGISGSAIADTSAIGSIVIPAMEKDGYTSRFASAITAASSVIGPIIPPSIIMILYAGFMGVSVAALFAAGFLPGLLLGGLLMITTGVIARRRNFPTKYDNFSLKRFGSNFTKAIPPLFAPVILIFGVVGGVFTPTEAGAVAVFYALVLSLFFYRSLTVRDLGKVFYRAAITSSMVLLVYAMASGFAFMANISDVSGLIGGLLAKVTTNKYMILFLINMILFVVGMFFDAGAAILICGPILAPIALSLGLHPVHFAMIMSINLTVGLVTPPIGLVLFVTSAISKEPVGEIVKEMWPFLIVEIAAVFLVTYIPVISLAVPRWLGFI